MSTLLQRFDKTGQKMGIFDGLAFGFIFLGYVAILGVYLSSFLICNSTVSDEMFHITIGITSGMLLLMIIYSSLVFTGKCGGDMNGAKKTSAIVVVFILLALSITDLVLICLSYEQRNKSITNQDSDELERDYNIAFGVVTLAIVVGLFFYFGYQVNDLV